MINCLIGYTGFVGGILARQNEFTHLFNSANISDLPSSPAFETVVCAAAPGSMFEANRLPDQDWRKLNRLMERLAEVRTKRFILISSIAVLADFSAGLDEGTDNFQTELAYGRHRRALEAFCEENFENCLIVRLPALFGKGLRKNFIFDLLNPVPTMLTASRLDALVAALEQPLSDMVTELYTLDPVTEMMTLDRKAFNADPRRLALDTAVSDLGFSATVFHNPETTYQYYDMARLWSDIERATKADLRHIHLVSEPLRAAEIHRRLLGKEMPEVGVGIHHEDMRTRHAGLWGGGGPYLEDAGAVLERLASFFDTERSRV